MAANYWESTQRKHWQFTKEQLASMRQKLEDEDPGLVQSFGLPQLRHLNIFFNQRELACNPITLLCISSSGLVTDTPVSGSLAYRNHETGKETWYAAAGYGHGPSICEALLHKSGNPEDESFSRHHHGSLLGM